MTERRTSETNLSLGRAASAAEGDLSLPRPPGVIRRFWARHPWLTDSLIAAVYLIPVALSLTVMADRPASTIGLLGPALALVSAAAVLFRRRTPLVALAVTIGCSVITFSSDAGLLGVGILFTLYAVAVYHSNRAAWIGLACAVAGQVLGSVVPFPTVLNLAQAAPAHATNAVFMLLAVLIGVNIGNRKRYVQALIDRAAQLARERDQQAQLATAAERSRIAREMHDIVSHSLTVMVSLADGSAALASASPARAEEAMRQVAETGRHALSDMRRMLGVLSESAALEHAPLEHIGAALEPQPGASDVSELVQRFRSAGLPARFSVTGAAPDDPGLQLTVYRVVQESLTNVLRHAGGASQVEVAVDYGAEAVTIRVDDDGHGADRHGHPGSVSAGALTSGTVAIAINGAGRGLLGMRERVGLYRGSLQAGPRPGGGWRVLATLHPLENGRQQ
jgi:signal transduction histidine kinase